MIKHGILGKLLVGAMTAGVIATTVLPAQAGEVWNRVENQQDRIGQGVSSGQLTRREYNQVESRLGRIDAQRQADLRRNGGYLTRAQHIQLNHELNRESRNIYFDKHNRADQPGV